MVCHRTRFSSKEITTVHLVSRFGRLLAVAALMIAGGIAGIGGPAVAESREGISPETLKGVCDLFGGSYTEDREDRDRENPPSYSCELTDSEIVCLENGDCAYQYSVPDLPLKETCENVRGTFWDHGLGVASCLLTQGELTVYCTEDKFEEPDKGTIEVRVCDVDWWSEQPMT